jgi:hypothetical protein
MMSFLRIVIGGGIAGVLLVLSVVFGVASFADDDEAFFVDDEVPTHAVVINEIMWAGIQYVELFNTTDGDISLEGWTLARQRAADEEPVIRVTFDADDSIAAGDYFIIERFVGGATQSRATTLSDEDVDKVISGSPLQLVNAGEYLELRDSGGALMDHANEVGPWFAGANVDDGRAMERIDPLESGTDSDNWQTYAEDIVNHGRLGTPKQENSVREDSVLPSPVLPILSPTPAATPVLHVDIRDIRDKPAGMEIVTEGIVLAPPGVFGDRLVYLGGLYARGPGIQVFFFHAHWPDLALGDRVRVAGEVSSALGEARVRVSGAADVVKTGSGNTPVAQILGPRD